MYNRHLDPDREIIESLRIKVETTPIDEYHRAQQRSMSGDEYNVALKDAEKAMALITEYYKALNYSFFKIYPIEWNRDYATRVLTLDYFRKLVEEAKKTEIEVETNNPKIKTR